MQRCVRGLLAIMHQRTVYPIHGSATVQPENFDIEGARSNLSRVSIGCVGHGGE